MSTWNARKKKHSNAIFDAIKRHRKRNRYFDSRNIPGCVLIARIHISPQKSHLSLVSLSRFALNRECLRARCENIPQLFTNGKDGTRNSDVCAIRFSPLDSIYIPGEKRYPININPCIRSAARADTISFDQREIRATYSESGGNKGNQSVLPQSVPIFAAISPIDYTRSLSPICCASDFAELGGKRRADFCSRLRQSATTRCGSEKERLKFMRGFFRISKRERERTFNCSDHKDKIFLFHRTAQG